MLKKLFLLSVAHAVGDMALRTFYIDAFKSPLSVGFGANGQEIPFLWVYVLLAHALINGGCYYYTSGLLLVGLLETVSHFTIDYVSGVGYMPLIADQICHALILFACALYWYSEVKYKNSVIH